MKLLKARQGTALSEIQSTVATVKQATENARGNEYPLQTMLHRVEMYADWATDAQAQLRNVFDAEFATELIQTDTYWKIRELSADAARLNTLVRAEYDARIRRFEDLLAALADEVKRWDAYAAPLIVPDTNILANPAMPIDSVSWSNLISATMQVRIVVPLAVVYELDALKSKGNQDTATAARAAIRWLHKHLPDDPAGMSPPLGSGSPDATVEVYVDGTTGALPDIDGQIIECCRWLRIASGLPVHLVTRDKNVDLRARTAAVDNVLFIPPPSKKANGTSQANGSGPPGTAL